MAEKLNWSEVENVVRAYRAEQGASADVDVATLAHVLGTDAAEVRRLAGRKPRFVDGSGVLSAGLALLSVLALGGLYSAAHLSRRHFAPSAPVAATPLESSGDLQIRIDDGDIRVISPDDDGTRIYAEGIGELVPSHDTKL